MLYSGDKDLPCSRGIVIRIHHVVCVLGSAMLCEDCDKDTLRSGEKDNPCCLGL